MTWNFEKYVDVYESELDGPMLEDALSDIDLVERFYRAWTGPRTDYGGGVISVSCSDIILLSEGKPRTLKKFASGLKLSECKRIIEACERELEMTNAR